MDSEVLLAAQTRERPRFEEYILSERGSDWLEKYTFKGETFSYKEDLIQEAWEAWMARAVLEE
jgi:hypothetical protein